MCTSTHFSIAIPLRNSKANTVIKALTILFLLLWVFLKPLSQMRIQFYVSFISASYASIKLNTKQFKSNA
jgi:putative alpha-1,2-mannosidase